MRSYRIRTSPTPSSWPVVDKGDHSHMEASGIVPQTQPKNKSEMKLHPGARGGNPCRPEDSRGPDPISMCLTVMAGDTRRVWDRRQQMVATTNSAKQEFRLSGCVSWDVLEEMDVTSGA